MKVIDISELAYCLGSYKIFLVNCSIPNSFYNCSCFNFKIDTVCYIVLFFISHPIFTLLVNLLEGRGPEARNGYP
jgi:hypothetical protein